VKHCQKKPSAFALFMSLFTFKLNIIACPIVKKTKKKLMNLKKKTPRGTCRHTGTSWYYSYIIGSHFVAVLGCTRQ
jgi:hypothetical protein